MKSSKSDYFLSLSAELTSQAGRVRQLIGDAHWGHDGRHKEILLRDIVRRHSPSSALVTCGFVVSPNDIEIRSTEQDILVVDCSNEAPLFHNGDLSIVFPHTVLAAISIKSTMDGQTVQSVVQGLKTVRDVARDANVDSNSIWCGGFFYTVNSQWLAEPAKIYTNLKTHISNNLSAKPLVPSSHPHIFGPDVLVDARDLAFLIDYQNSHNTPSAQVRGYSCDGASTSIFLSCLLEHLTNRLTGLHSPFADAVAELQVQQLEPPHVSFDL